MVFAYVHYLVNFNIITTNYNIAIRSFYDSYNRIMLEMKKCYLESMSRAISYTKQVNGRLTGLVAFCVETAFYNGLLKER